MVSSSRPCSGALSAARASSCFASRLARIVALCIRSTSARTSGGELPPQQQLEVHLQPGERRPQLVRCVRQEPLLHRVGFAQPDPSSSIERVDDRRDFDAAPRLRDRTQIVAAQRPSSSVRTSLERSAARARSPTHASAIDASAISSVGTSSATRISPTSRLRLCSVSPTWTTNPFGVAVAQRCECFSPRYIAIEESVLSGVSSAAAGRSRERRRRSRPPASGPERSTLSTWS